MIRRYREILNVILNTDGYVTGNELAKLCNISIRTIRLDIKAINNLLEEYNMKIDSIIKKGYYLTEDGKKLLKENDIIKSVWDHEYIAQIANTPFERQMSMEILDVLKKELDLNVRLIELVYIAMHLVSTRELWNKKLKAIIVCDYDQSIINLIKNKIFTYLSEKISFCGSYTYQEFTFGLVENLEEIDFIITSWKNEYSICYNKSYDRAKRFNKFI